MSKMNGLLLDSQSVLVVVGMDNVADSSLLEQVLMMSSMIEDQSVLVAASAFWLLYHADFMEIVRYDRAVSRPPKTRCSKSKAVAEGVTRQQFDLS